jgi:hypothetical protein
MIPLRRIYRCATAWVDATWRVEGTQCRHLLRSKVLKKVLLILGPWRWKRYVSSKRRVPFSQWRSVISKIIELSAVSYFLYYLRLMPTSTHDAKVADITAWWFIKLDTKWRREIIFMQLLLNTGEQNPLYPSERELMWKLWKRKVSLP